MFASKDFTLGQMNALVKKIGKDNVLPILDGSLKFQIVEPPAPIATFTVDTTGAVMPEDWQRGRWTVEEHKSLGVVEVSFRDGKMYVNDCEVTTYLSTVQQNGRYIVGDKLRTELTNHDVLPDAILELLIKEQDNPTVVTFMQQFKVQYPFFWGTIYRDPDGGRGVRYLFWDGERWDWGDCWLGDDWYGSGPAFVLAHSSDSGT